MEGQKLGLSSILGERHGPWLNYSVTQSLTEQIHVSDTAAYSQDGLARVYNIQDARGGGLCWNGLKLSNFLKSARGLKANSPLCTF